MCFECAGETGQKVSIDDFFGMSSVEFLEIVDVEERDDKRHTSQLALSPEVTKIIQEQRGSLEHPELVFVPAGGQVSGDAFLFKHGQHNEICQVRQDERLGLLQPVFLHESVQLIDGPIEDLDSFGVRCRGSELVSFHGSQPSNDNEHALEQRDQLVSDLYTHGGNRPLRV